VPNDPSNANNSTKSIVEELESITCLLDEIEGDCAKLSDNSREQEIPILSHIIEGSNTVTTKVDNMMVAQSLFPTNDETIDQVIPTLTQSLTTAKPKVEEEQLILPPVEELDAELAQSQHSTEQAPLVTPQQIEDAVKQCMAELEPIVREKITELLSTNNN
jgi:hemerythrin superfamily protein